MNTEVETLYGGVGQDGQRHTRNIIIHENK